MTKDQGTLKRVAVAVCVMGLLGIPRSVHADIVVVNFSGTYFELDNLSSTGTFTGYVEFDNVAGTPIFDGISTDRGIPGGAFCPADRCSFFDGDFDFRSIFSESAFSVAETSLVGITDLTPRQVSGIYGGFAVFNPFMPLDVAFSSITYAPGVVLHTPEPSPTLLMATGLVFLLLGKLTRGFRFG